MVDDLLGSKTGGFFVECGAGDGEFLSNTLFFEAFRNWTGLLVEADRRLFAELRANDRRSYAINACLSPNSTPAMLEYTNAGLNGGLASHMEPSQRRDLGRHRFLTGSDMVQCFPLASILKAIGVSHIDYLSLDTEGSEVSILKSIPYDDVTIDAISVEYRTVGSPEKNAETIS